MQPIWEEKQKDVLRPSLLPKFNVSDIQSIVFNVADERTLSICHLWLLS